jgi:hypothetical protein
MANGGGEGDHGQSIVVIKVGGTDREIHRGRRSVAEIKQVGGVPVEYDLDQVIDGQLTPLKDDASVTIKGGEVFLGHPKDGSSS